MQVSDPSRRGGDESPIHKDLETREEETEMSDANQGVVPETIKGRVY